MEQVVHRVKHGESAALNGIQVARFDITVHPPTEAMEEAGFAVEVTPTLYLVKLQQEQPERPILHKGDLALTEIVEWIERHVVSE